MPRAIELLQQGRHEELWQMCCGYLNLDTKQFMDIQNRLLLGQIQTLQKSSIGRKIFQGFKPQTVKDFRQLVPLTTYAHYCPELSEKRGDILPEDPSMWVHTSGWSGEYSCKWIPLSSKFVEELSPILYGVGLLASCSRYGETSQLMERPKMIYTVAPRPYMTGSLAEILGQQTPSYYLPSIAEAEKIPFEDRIRLAFKEALSSGLDCFFGLSLVLAAVGEKFSDSANNINYRSLLSNPRALFRLTRGVLKAKLAGRSLLPKDLWNVKAIITGGLDSAVYKEKIKDFWGRYPLDVYATSEGGIIATQTWDYDGMTFIPNLNFLEFIPEKEQFKWQMDHTYQPKTVLLDEVKAGEVYEIVITNFHGGALVRYRVGDMIRITSLTNEKLGIRIPQMVFERRADDLLDFVAVRLSERTIWKSIENAGIRNEGWLAYKNPGELTLNLLIELKDQRHCDVSDIENRIYKYVMAEESKAFDLSKVHKDGNNMVKLDIKVTLLETGSFARYTAAKQAEGADPAHLKPPHVNPSPDIISLLLSRETIKPELTLNKTINKPKVPVG